MAIKSVLLEAGVEDHPEEFPIEARRSIAAVVLKDEGSDLGRLAAAAMSWASCDVPVVILPDDESRARELLDRTGWSRLIGVDPGMLEAWISVCDAHLPRISVTDRNLTGVPEAAEAVMV